MKKEREKRKQQARKRKKREKLINFNLSPVFPINEQTGRNIEKIMHKEREKRERDKKKE